MVYIDIDSKHILHIKSEADLQKAVVKYLRETDLAYCSTLGECLDTTVSRIEAVKRGYKCGIPDLIIYTPNNCYNGLAIEFKAATGFGNLKKNQLDWLNQLEKDCNYFVIASNDYTTIIETIIKYIHDLL
jgi:hypothetical protein